MKKLVTIIGRSNVGKSALFNKLADHKRALVLDTIGVTRDPIHDTSSWRDYQYTIADTAGFITDKKIAKNDEITKLSIEKARQYLANADVILFMIDGAVGYSQEDMQLFSNIKKLQKSIIIVINKSDLKDSQENCTYIHDMFHGYPVVLISAIHSININGLQDTIVSLLPSKNNDQNANKKEESKVAILGKPNVGKSSIINILAEKNIAIVAPIAGTTRETVSEALEIENQTFIISDTAGVRKSRAIDERIEELMVSNTMNTIQSANIVVMVFDVNEPTLSDQDIKLMTYAWDTLYKAVLVVWNKVDLIPAHMIKKKIEDKNFLYKHIFDNIPQVMFSTIDPTYTKEIILDAIVSLSARYNQFLDPKEIKMIIREAMHKNPLYKIRQKLDFQKLDVVHTAPPTIIIYSRQKMLFSKSEIAFFQRQIRMKKDLFGIPIKIIIK